MAAMGYALLKEKPPLGQKITDLGLHLENVLLSACCVGENVAANEECTSGYRYLTSDPIGLQGGVNAYVGNNPLSNIDPLGLMPTSMTMGDLALILATSDDFNAFFGADIFTPGLDITSEQDAINAIKPNVGLTNTPNFNEFDQLIQQIQDFIPQALPTDPRLGPPTGSDGQSPCVSPIPLFDLSVVDRSLETVVGLLRDLSAFRDNTEQTFDEVGSDPGTNEFVRFLVAFFETPAQLGTGLVSAVGDLGLLTLSQEERDLLVEGVIGLIEDPELLIEALEEFADQPGQEIASDGFVIVGEVVIGFGLIRRIQELARAARVRNGAGLTQGQIAEHLARFDGGVTRFVPRRNFDRFGVGQADGTAFVIPTAEADRLLANANGDPRLVEQALGLPENFLDGNELVRIDIANPRELNLRVPSGNEAGANDQFIPGGFTEGGLPEAVIDVDGIPPDRFSTTSITF